MHRILFLLGFAALAALSASRADDKPDATTLDLKLGDQLVGRFHYQGPKLAKPYIWPLLAPGGVPVTRAWPMDPTAAKSRDHVHQKSAWFCHGDVIAEGIGPAKGIDFWSETPGHGRIVNWGHAIGTTNGAPSIALFNYWQAPSGDNVLTERTDYRLYELGSARLIVVHANLKADFCPITFGDTKEGSLGVRVSDQLAAAVGHGTITNADGKTGEKACWGQLSKWCDYSGTVDGKPVGIAIFDGPKNKYPACWHVRSYGLMAANPFGRNKSGFPAMKGRTDLVKLAKGESLTLTYGILLHTGDAKSGDVAKHYDEFVKLVK